MTNDAQRLLDENVVLNVEQAARVMNVGKSSMYAAIKSNQIPHIVVGRNIRISTQALRALLSMNGLPNDEPT